MLSQGYLPLLVLEEPHLIVDTLDFTLSDMEAPGKVEPDGGR